MISPTAEAVIYLVSLALFVFCVIFARKLNRLPFEPDENR